MRGGDVSEHWVKRDIGAWGLRVGRWRVERVGGTERCTKVRVPKAA